MAEWRQSGSTPEPSGLTKPKSEPYFTYENRQSIRGFSLAPDGRHALAILGSNGHIDLVILETATRKTISRKTYQSPPTAIQDPMRDLELQWNKWTSADSAAAVIAV